MNEQEAAELLERLGSREEVGSPPMADLFRAGRQVRRRRHIMQGTGVAAAVAVVSAGGFALQLQHDRDVPTATSTTPTVTKTGATLVVPVGTRLVGEGAVVVAVPKTWTTNDIKCSSVGSNTVTFNNDGPWATCAGGYSHASVLSVADPASRQWDTRLQLTAKKVSVDGMSGLRTPTLCTATPDPTCAGVLTFPEEKVSFAVSSPDDKIVNKVLDSAERLPAGYVTVPDLEGMSAADARQTLTAQGLVMDPPCGNRDHCTFHVTSTTPGQGSAVTVGSTVTINLPKPASSDHGPLTNREFSVAVAIARSELKQNPPWSVSSVTATVSKGKVLHGNVGAQRHCLSGTLVNIKFIGKFPNIGVSPQPGQTKHLSVSAVLVVADPVSREPCLTSVQTGHTAPARGATPLFAR